MQRIKYATGCSSYKTFIGGSDNFRYAINPEYKANRKDMPRPEWLQQVREHLVVQHGAKICDNIEADDALGIEQTMLRNELLQGYSWQALIKQEGKNLIESNGEPSVICSVDKDLLMIPGNHYNFVKDEHSVVTPLQGKRWFYVQLILGDKADNIFGYDGKARTVVPQFLQPDVDCILSYETELAMYQHVLDMYQMHGQGKEVMHMNARCLYIQHKEGDEWDEPFDPQKAT